MKAPKRGGARPGAGRRTDPSSKRTALQIRIDAEARDRYQAAAALDPDGRTLSEIARELLDAWAERALR